MSFTVPDENLPDDRPPTSDGTDEFGAMTVVKTVSLLVLLVGITAASIVLIVSTTRANRNTANAVADNGTREGDLETKPPAPGGLRSDDESTPPGEKRAHPDGVDGGPAPPFGAPAEGESNAAGANNHAEPESPVKLPPSDKSSQGQNEAPGAKGREYQQFAELASMFDSVGVGRATWNYQSMYLERSAPWRAKKLLSLKMTNPVLQKAALRFVGIAMLYYISVQCLDNTNWKPDEIEDAITGLIATLKRDKDNDFPINTIVDQLENKNSVIRGTLARLALQDASAKFELAARISHSRMWADVLAQVKPDGGAESAAFPLRLGDFWIRNVSGETQTNITIAVKTSSSSDLSADGSPYVVFLDRFEPGEQIDFPFFLINQLWDERKRAYGEKKASYTCSVWSDRCRFEDVSFDFKQVPKGMGTYGAFPSTGFAGKYDATAPWASPPVRPQPFGGTGIWVGQYNETNEPIKLYFARIGGSRYQAFYGGGQPGVDRSPVLRLEGHVRDQKIEMDTVAFKSDDPDGPSYWGTIKDDKLELSYGKNHVQEGTISLHFLKNERAGKGTLRLLNATPLPPGAQAWIEIDGKRTADWKVGTKESGLSLEPGTYRVTVYSVFNMVKKTCYDKEVKINPGPPTNIPVDLVTGKNRTDR